MLAHFLVVYGTFFVISVFSFEAYIFILLNIALVVLIHLRLQRPFSYLFLFFILTSISYPEFGSLKDYLFEKDSQKKFLFEVTIVWLNAKLLSFNLDRLNELKRKRDNERTGHHRMDDDFDLIFAKVNGISRDEYLHLFAYLFYVPTLFTGPLNQYAPFVRVSNTYILHLIN